MKKRVSVIVVLLCCFITFGISHAQEQAPENLEPGTSGSGQGFGNQELLNRIEDLEKRINEMTEESRARRKLEITEQEREEKEKEVLEAVSRDYSMNPKHTLGLDYSLLYQYSPSEKYLGQPLIIQREIDHTIKHIISTSYSVLDNLAVSTSIPFVYRYNELGTDTELDETDIGDISAGFTVQPFKSGEGGIRTTVSVSAAFPTGRSTFKINPATELSTGDGIYAFSVTGNFSKQIDPVVAFWNAGFTYKMDATGLDYKLTDTIILEKVETGNAFFFGAGLGYALSYKVSVNSSFSYTYNFSTKYHYNQLAPAESGDDVSATISFGLGWKVSNRTSLSFGLGYELTGSGFSLTFRAPFTFVL